MTAKFFTAVLFLWAASPAIHAQAPNYQIASAGDTVVLLNTKTGQTWILDNRSWMPLPKAPLYPDSRKAHLLKLKAELEHKIKEVLPKVYNPGKAKAMIREHKKELELIQEQLDSIEKSE